MIENRIYIIKEATKAKVEEARAEVLDLAAKGEIDGFVAEATGGGLYDLDIKQLADGLKCQDLTAYKAVKVAEVVIEENVQAPSVEELTDTIESLKTRITELEPLAEKYEEYADIIAKIEHLGDSKVAEIEAENERLRGIICTVKKELESVE